MIISEIKIKNKKLSKLCADNDVVSSSGKILQLLEYHVLEMVWLTHNSFSATLSCDTIFGQKNYYPLIIYEVSFRRGASSLVEYSFTNKVGEMTGNEIRPFLKSRIMIPLRLCSLLIHSPGICMPGPIE